MSRCSYEVYLG